MAVNPASLPFLEAIAFFRAKLLDLYPELDDKAFADLMGQALAVADAAGYWEAQA